MKERFLVAAVLILASLNAESSEPMPSLTFNWTPGQTLDYRVQQTTHVQEVTADDQGRTQTAEVRTVLMVLKRWTVREVEAAGVATLDLSILQMRQTMTRADGKTTSIDSENPEDAKQLAEVLNKPVLTLRVDRRGQILEVRESRPGSARRIEAELPFRLILPERSTVPQWGRTFTITLEPPHGTGERYEASQSFTYKGSKDGLAVIGVTTQLANEPATASEKLPLLPMLWSGEVFFDPNQGRYHAARLVAKAVLTGHQGPASKFTFHSTYQEELTQSK